MTDVNDAIFAARQVSDTRRKLQAREENAKTERIRKDALSRGQQVCGTPHSGTKPPQAE